MAVSDHFRDRALDSVLVGVFASLHDDDPGETGTNEIAGGSPVYERLRIDFFPSAGGTKEVSSAPVFDVPADTTVRHVGFWDSFFGGNFFLSAPLEPEAFTGQGTYTLLGATVEPRAEPVS